MLESASFEHWEDAVEHLLGIDHASFPSALAVVDGHCIVLAEGRLSTDGVVTAVVGDPGVAAAFDAAGTRLAVLGASEVVVVRLAPLARLATLPLPLPPPRTPG